MIHQVALLTRMPEEGDLPGRFFSSIFRGSSFFAPLLAPFLLKNLIFQSEIIADLMFYFKLSLYLSVIYLVPASSSVINWSFP